MNVDHLKQGWIQVMHHITTILCLRHSSDVTCTVSSWILIRCLSTDSKLSRATWPQSISSCTHVCKLQPTTSLTSKSRSILKDCYVAVCHSVGFRSKIYLERTATMTWIIINIFMQYVLKVKRTIKSTACLSPTYVTLSKWAPATSSNKSNGYMTTQSVMLINICNVYNTKCFTAMVGISTV